jgi:hypothetical protein
LRWTLILCCNRLETNYCVADGVLFHGATGHGVACSSHQPGAPHRQAQGEPSPERSDTSGASQAKNHEPDVLGQHPNDQDTTEEDALVGNINRASGDASLLASLEASENTEPNSGSSARKDEGLAEYRP